MTIVEVHKPLDEILRIVHEIKDSGYYQGEDFDFAYHQSQWDSFSGVISKEHTKFIFYKEELSLFFALRYGD